MRAPEDEVADRRPAFAPIPLGAALALCVSVFVFLMSNGRPIGAGDTRPTERAAASLVQEGNLDLDEYPELEPPFARNEGVHRVSIYPVLPAVLAAPAFALARVFFTLDEAGCALAGKLAASLLSSLAAGVLFLGIGRRALADEARWAAVVFALGTSVWSTSQALWQHPAAVLFLCVAVVWMQKAEEDEVWAGRAGLPLSLALAARHADVALVAVLALGIAARWPRRLAWLVVWGAPGAMFVLVYNQIYFGSPFRHGFSGSAGRFAEAWGEGHLGLLVSPAKGLLVFTPVAAAAAVGIVLAYKRGERWLAGTLGAAILAHWVFVGRWNEWHGGESWGPRMMTDALPLLFLFLPDGLEACGRAGSLLAVVSIGIQALGAFTYDYRWERLHQRPEGRPVLWDVVRSPIVLALEERAFILAVPGVQEGRAFLREHRMVFLGPEGSRIRFVGDRPVVQGSDPTLGDVHLERGARIEEGALRLRGRGNVLFLRVLPGARTRRLELRMAGRGQGTLYVGEKTFWSRSARWTHYPISGSFRLVHAYHYPDSGGPDITLAPGPGGGEVELASVALVPPSEPDDPIRLP